MAAKELAAPQQARRPFRSRHRQMGNRDVPLQGAGRGDLPEASTRQGVRAKDAEVSRSNDAIFGGNMIAPDAKPIENRTPYKPIDVSGRKPAPTKPPSEPPAMMASPAKVVSGVLS